MSPPLLVADARTPLLGSINGVGYEVVAAAATTGGESPQLGRTLKVKALIVVGGLVGVSGH